MPSPPCLGAASKPENNMSEDIIFTVGFMGITAFVLYLAWQFNAKSRGDIRTQYEQLAKTFSLNLDIPKPSMRGLKQDPPVAHGKHQKRDVSIFSKSYGLDNLRQTDTCIRLQTRASKKIHFILSKRNLSGKVGQIGRHKELKTGDAQFDDQFILRSKVESEIILPLFEDSTRTFISKQLSSDTGFLTLEDGVLSYIEFGLIETDEKRLHIERMLTSMSQWADSLEKSRK